MFELGATRKVYLSLAATDMRRGIDSLAGAVQDYFGRNSLDGCLYVFVSGDRKKVKILEWEEDGYWIHYKRLESSTFRVRKVADGREELSAVDLKKLLSGIDLKRIRLSKKVNQQLCSLQHA